MKTHQSHTPTIDENTIAKTEERGRPEEGRLYSINPVDRSIVGEVELTPAKAAGEIVERAREAQRAWMRRPLLRRIERGRRVCNQVLDWRAELLELLVDETGKSELQAKWELWKICEEVIDLLGQASEKLGPGSKTNWRRPSRRTEWDWKPRGVVMIVASSYEPLQSVVAPALAALIAGNSVIVVADEQTPLVVHSVTNIATSAGVPDSLWIGLAGGRRLIDALADRVDAIISYGPSMVTRRLARRQGDRMIPVMGRWATRDVMIVLNDADVKRAARAAVCGACSGAGRTRRSLRRIYVQDSVADQFVDAVVEEMGTLKQGDVGGHGELEIGPMFEREDLEKMEELVNDASSSGARLVAGGRARPRCRGSYFEPTVLINVDESMRLWKEPIAGPVVAMARIQAPAEAVRRTRDVDGYGAVSIFTGNKDVARSLAGRLGAPVVGINEFVNDVPAVSPPVRGTIDGPFDPVGADRLQALSHRVMTVERRWSGLPSILESRSPRRAGQALDAAITVLHRRGWIRSAMNTIIPGR